MQPQFLTFSKILVIKSLEKFPISEIILLMVTLMESMDRMRGLPSD